MAEKDYTKLPATITLTNVNTPFVAETEDDTVMHANDGVVVVNYFQTNLEEVLAPGDVLKILATSSEAVAYYSQLATDELTVEVSKGE